MFLETERLVLRRLVRADAELLFELDSDAEVRRTCMQGLLISTESVTGFYRECWPTPTTTTTEDSGPPRRS